MASGNERRSADQDHDMIVEMHTLLKGLKETHEKHVLDDEKHFGRLYRGQNKLFWFTGIGLGIVVTLKLLLK